MTTSLPQKIGPYQIVRLLGEGGMGAVYLGRHAVLDVHHAVKVLSSRLGGDADFVARLHREARNAARLHHPHIVQVVGADEDRGRHYIAMQFVDGRPLEKIVREDGPLPVHRAVRYVHQVADALAYAHGEQVVHRDIKPDNVLIDGVDAARLTDFGLVHDADSKEAGLTRSGTVLGTPQYMSPEQWQGEGIDARTDVFALGVMLYFLLTRRFPFPGEGPAQILRRQIAREMVPITERPGEWDPRLVAIIHGAVELSIGERTHSAGALRDALGDWWSANPPADARLTLGKVDRPAPAATESRRVGASGSDVTVHAAVSSGSDLLHLSTGVPPPPPPGAVSGADGADVTLTHHAGPEPDAVVVGTAVGVGVSQAPGPDATGTPATPVGATAATSVQSGPGKALWFAVTALVAAVVGLVVFLAATRTNDDPSGTDGPTVAQAARLELDLPVGRGTETQPLLTGMADFSLGGNAVGPVTVNGEPYELGSRLTLDPGLNRLRVTAGEGPAAPTRTVFVVFDDQAPVLTVPAFADSAELVSDADVVDLRGSVTDNMPGVVVEVDLGREGMRTIPLDADGSFVVQVPLPGDAPVTVELVAVDAAENRSLRVSGRVIPDRKPLALSFDDAFTLTPELLGVTDPTFVLTGGFSKDRGITAAVSAEPAIPGLTIEVDGAAFRIRGSESIAGGLHVLTVTAQDRVGRNISQTRSLLIAPAAAVPIVSEPVDGAGVWAVSPDVATILVRATIGSLWASLPTDARARVTMNGKAVEIADDGSIATTLVPEAFGEMTVTVAVRDPFGRETEVRRTINVRRQTHRLIGVNDQGAVEYERLIDGMTVVLIPGGDYQIGRADGAGTADAPRTAVRLSPYLIDKFEVSNAQLARFLNGTKLDLDAARRLFGVPLEAPDSPVQLRHGVDGWSAVDGAGNFPAIGLTWDGAAAYARWAGGDLPSEAQWEVAASGGRNPRDYPWGDGRPSIAYANFRFSGFGGRLTWVDNLPDGRSPFGLHNMCGNAAEWVRDWYLETGYVDLAGGTDPVNSVLPPNGTRRRVVRGGSMKTGHVAGDCPLKTYARSFANPTGGTDDRGLRLAAPIPDGLPAPPSDGD
jgi:serine/threonine protein kinase/formylglycine-generating enzyme required for sulfatase activity